MTPARPTVDVDGLAVHVCARSRKHGGGSGKHDAEKYGPCGDHKRIVTETAAALDLPDLLAQLAAVTAERDEARAAVERVRALPTVSLTHGWANFRSEFVAATDLTAALDHVPTTEGGEG